MRLPILLLVVASCFAQAPLATLSTSAPFRLNGAGVPAAGIPRWPLSAPAELVTGDAPSLVTFRDHSRLWLLPNTRVSLTERGERVLVRVSEGGLAYKFSPNTLIDLAARSEPPLPARSREGRLWTSGDENRWAPSEQIFLAMTQPGRPRTINFSNYRVTPFNLGQLSDWRNFNPPFGNPPGTSTPGSNLPPGQILTSELPPVSLFQP